LICHYSAVYYYFRAWFCRGLRYKLFYKPACLAACIYNKI